MPTGEIVEIKLRKKYLKNYILHKYGSGQEPITATISNKLFPFLSQFLSHQPKNWHPPEPKDDNVLFQLPYNDIYETRNLRYINPRHHSEISNFFYGMFYADFISYMTDRHIKRGWQIKYAIIKFIDDYDMHYNKDTFWTLHKIFYRFRNQKKGKNVTVI